MVPYLELILGFVTFSYLLETYLDVRQHNNYKVKVLPEKIKKYNIITQEEFAKSQAYGLDKRLFLFLFFFLLPFFFFSSSRLGFPTIITKQVVML
jgi:hypothetical protein